MAVQLLMVGGNVTAAFAVALPSDQEAKPDRRRNTDGWRHKVCAGPDLVAAREYWDLRERERQQAANDRRAARRFPVASALTTTSADGSTTRTPPVRPIDVARSGADDADFNVRFWEARAARGEAARSPNGRT